MKKFSKCVNIFPTTRCDGSKMVYFMSFPAGPFLAAYSAFKQSPALKCTGKPAG
jgi:hypothetical protein